MNLFKMHFFRMAQNLVMLVVLAVTVAVSASAREITLQDDRVLIAFDSKSGAITRLTDKASHWKIERRPELGVSFRLFAPLPGRRWNPVLGQKQVVAEIEKISRHEIELEWKNPVSENGGVLPMILTAHVTLTNGVLTFNLNVQNDSDLTVESIDYPYFGDFNAPSHDSTNLVAWTMKQGNVDDLGAEEIYPHFRNEKGYWGVFWPTKILEAEHSPCCLIQSPDSGIYIGAGATPEPYRLQYVFEQHPGLLSVVTGLVPPEDEIGGQTVHLEFRLCHLVFQQPHTIVKLTPVVLSCYRGDRHAGSALYKQWHSTSQ
jgi:hypothetical protein